MTNTFELLARFLEKYGDEVEGRSLDELPEDVRTKLRAFASGKLPGPERQDMARILKENPKWIAVLADDVKAARAAGGGAKSM